MSTSPSLTHALDALAQQDEDVARAIASYGYPQDRSMPQTYESLAKIIIGQQISRAVASHIWEKLGQAGFVSGRERAPDKCAVATPVFTSLDATGGWLAAKLASVMSNL